MRTILAFAFFILTGTMLAQPPRMELKPTGFDPITVSIAATPNDKLIELTKSWAMEFNRRERDKVDITNVTANSMTVSAYRKNAFSYSNRGETFYQKIHYNMDIVFSGDSYTLTFTVTDIFADDNKRLTYLLPDYFLPDGRAKEDYDDVKPTLEKSVNAIVRSHYNFITNYQ